MKHRSNVIEEFTNGELLKIITGDWTEKVVLGIEKAIKYSYDTDYILVPVFSRDEIERRFKICVRWFVTLRRDLHWSVPRILDEMPTILRKELDGCVYNPDENRNSWHSD